MGSFERHGELCRQYLARGRQVYVDGRLKTDRWKDKQNGQDRQRVKVVACGFRNHAASGSRSVESIRATYRTHGQCIPAPRGGPARAPHSTRRARCAAALVQRPARAGGGGRPGRRGGSRGARAAARSRLLRPPRSTARSVRASRVAATGDRIQRLLQQVSRRFEVTATRGLDREYRARLDEHRCGRRRTRHTVRTGRHGFWCAGGAQRTIRKRRRPRPVGFPCGIAAF